MDLLATQLIGILCQKLVPSTDGGLHLLVEHVENAGAVRDWIRRRDASHIQEHLNRGSDPSAVPFLRSTLKALQSNIISEAVAIEASGNESELKRAMRGVQ